MVVVPAGQAVGAVTKVPFEQATVLGPKPPAASRRSVAKKSGDAVEDVATFEKSAEDLRVHAMHPLAADLNGVRARNDGKVVFDLRAPECLVNVRPKEEWVTEAECGREAHGCVGGNV